MKRLFQIIFGTESILHNEEDSQTIAVQVMKAACDLYEADQCGILIADLQTQAFTPEIWYEVGKGAIKETLFNDIEFTEEFATWAQHLVEQKPLFIPDVEQIKEVNPKEYEAYQRLDARAIMGVIFGQHPLGFMVVRNMKRYGDRPEPLQLACFVAMMMLEQIRRQRMEKLFSTHEVDDRKFHIRYNILGSHNVVIDGREIYENELHHPNRRAWIVLLYLVLHRQPVDQDMLIADNWPDEPEDKIKNSLRQSLFRIHNELSAYHDVKVVDARGGQMKFSDDVRVTTDAEEMEALYKKAKQTRDEGDKIEILKKAFLLYRGRLFLQGGEDETAFVASAKDLMYGSGVIAYPHFMKDTAEKLKSSFYLIPSSIHEVIILKDDGTESPERIKEVVRTIRKRQMEGIDAAKAKGVKFGRKDKGYPEEWELYYLKYEMSHEKSQSYISQIYIKYTGFFLIFEDKIQMS